MASKSEKKLIDARIKNAELFNRNIKKLMRIIYSKTGKNLSTKANINWLQNKIKIGVSISVFEIIERCQDKIVGVTDHIKKKNVKFFLDRKYDEYIKQDDNQKFIVTIIELIQKGYPHLKEDEKKEIWGIAKQLLICSLKNKISVIKD